MTPCIQLRDITYLSRDDAMKVLTIRNDPAVRNNMYTTHIISEEEHFNWINELRKRDDVRFFAAVVDDEIVGGASISAINYQHRRADWAFYLAPKVQGRGIGSALERQFVTMAFDQFGIDKLNCEVIEFNTAVIAMHEKFGFTREGVRRDHVIRDGERYGAVLLGITKDEWHERLQRDH